MIPKVPALNEPAPTNAPREASASAAAATASIWIGEQSQDGQPFSRGRVLNALFLVATAASTRIDRVVFHDVDLLPDVDRVRGFFAPLPAALGDAALVALNATGEYAGATGYIGGITLLTPAAFVGADGFPNAFQGWGGEDDALRDRVPHSNILTWTRGTVRNLELDPGVRRPSDVRARDSSAMPRDARRAVRQRWKARDSALTGLAGLVYSAVPEEPSGGVAGTSGAGSPAVVIQRHHIHVNVAWPQGPDALPDGWVRAHSALCGLPYYVHTPTGKTSKTPPIPAR